MTTWGVDNGALVLTITKDGRHLEQIFSESVAHLRMGLELLFEESNGVEIRFTPGGTKGVARQETDGLRKGE